MDGFETLEIFCETGKASPAANEDRYVMTDAFAAVIDGATSSGPLDGIAGGIVAAETVAQVVRDLTPGATAEDFVALATARLASRIGPKPANAARPSAAAVVWSQTRREVWRVGDCHVRIDGVDHLGDKPLDKLAYEFRCAVLRAELALGLTSEDVQFRVAVLDQPFRPLVLVQHAYANLDAEDPLAFGALDGRPVPARFVDVIPAPQAREIVLCSDGFPKPYATLAEGLAELARLKAADPLLIREMAGSRPFPPASAYYDDATWLRLRV